MNGPSTMLTHATRVSADRGELARLYLTHAPLLGVVLACWWIVVWVVPILVTRTSVLVCGAGIAALIACRIGGAEAMEGSESALYAMPGSPRRRYWLRALIVMALVLLIVGSAALAVAFQLPERLWGLLLPSSGLAHRPEPAEGFLRPVLMLLLPYTAMTYALAMAARHPTVVRASWAIVGLVLLPLAVLVQWVAFRLHVGMNDGVEVVGVVLGILAMLVGEQCYLRKEPLDRPMATSSAILLLVAILAVVLTAFVVAMMPHG